MKKVVAILLAALVLSATLISCTDAQEGSADSTGMDETTSTSEEAEDSSGAEAVQLTILTPLLPAIQDLDTNTHTLWIEEQTGVDIIWETIPQAAQGGTEKLQLLLTGAELPDVFMNAPFTSDMIATFGVEEQILLPLNDYIGKNTPNLDAAMEAYAERGMSINQMRQTDGNIYSLPVLDTCEHCEYAAKMWYYEPFLTELGIDPPTTTEEFYDYLVMVRDNDVNGNGDPSDEIPLIAADGSGWHTQTEKYLMNAFAYYTTADYRGLYLEDGKVVTSLDSDGVREGFEYIHMLYDEGLLYKDSVTIENDTLTQIVETQGEPIVANVPGGWPGVFSTVGSDRYNNFRSLPPLEGPSGEQNAVKMFQGITGGYATAYILSIDCEDPVAAIEFADFMYTPENTLSVRGGLGGEGVGWERAEEGAESIYGGQAFHNILEPWNDTDPQNISWLAMGVWDYVVLRTASSIPEGLEKYSSDGLEWMLYSETVEKYRPYGPTDGIDAIPPLAFTAEEASENARVIADIFTKSYFDTARLDFISGNKDIADDEVWQEYIDGLYLNGYQDLIDNYQTAYDRQYGA